MSERLHTLQSLVSKLSEPGDRPCIVEMREEDVRTLSYGEVSDLVRRLARGLAGSGIDRGEPVALLAPNQPEWIVACLAVIEAGAVVVPLDAGLGDEELSHALSDSGAGRIFTTGRHAKRIEGLDLERPPEPVLLDADAGEERSWRGLFADDAPERRQPEPEDPAALFYTSGTTGRAKGVPLSHGNLVFQLNALIEAGVVWEDDRVLLPLPLHHVYPFAIGMLTPLALGLPIVLPKSLTGPQLARAMREGEASVVVGVPRLYEALYSGIKERMGSLGSVPERLFEAAVEAGVRSRKKAGRSPGKLLLRPLHARFGPRLRVLASGGAPLDEDLAWKLEGLGWKVAIGYGLTETSPLLTLAPPESPKLASVGLPIPGIEVLVDPAAVPGASGDEGYTDSPGREGEVLARGPGVFSGYRNMPEETEEVLTEDGWFRTGDLGYFDDDGYLYVTGRASTLIVTEAGKNVQPEEVEEAYLENPVIREIGVLQKDGRLVALVVPEPGEAQHAEDLTAAVREAVSAVSGSLPSHMQVSDFAVTRAPLEYTQLGKLRRHVLEDRYEQARSGEGGPEESPGPVPLEEMSGEDRTLLERPGARQVWDWLADRYPERRLAPETNLQMDLDVDSLEWVNLTMEIGQRTGVELPEEAIEEIEEVRDLLEEVARRAEAGEEASGVSPLEDPEGQLDEGQKKLLRPRSPAEAAAARALSNLNRLVARGVFGLRVEGSEHLPSEGPYVVTPNHVSYLDSFAVGAALGYRRLEDTYWAGWAGAAFGNPVNRLFSRLARVVPIDPDRAGLSSLAFSAAVLDRGKNLVWFPEGERSPTGDLQRFQPGIGLLLDHFRVPVVPVFVHGTGEAMPRGQGLPRPAKVTVSFGAPVHPDELEEQGGGETPQDRIVAALRERVAELGRRS